MMLFLIFELYAPDIIIFCALAVIFLTGQLSPKEAFLGFSNPGMLTVAVLFIVAYAAQSSGILEYFANHIMGRCGRVETGLIRMMAPVMILSAFLNNTPIVAMFIPTIRDWAIKNRMSPSKFLIPLSYAAIFGGTCTLIGTSTNLVVNGLFRQEFQQSLGMFELAYVGIPCAVLGSMFLLAGAKWLLPGHGALSENFCKGGREYLLEMKVHDSSPLVGKSIQEASLRNLEQVYLAEIQRNVKTIAPVRPGDILAGGDHLFFVGQADGVLQLQKLSGLTPCHERDFCAQVQQTGGGRIVEAVVSRSSPMLGKTIKEGNFRARYDAAVLAVHRHGQQVHSRLGKLILKPGDTLLLLAGDDFFKKWNQSRDFYMISKVTDVPVLNRKKTWISLATLLGMVGLAATGTMDIFNAAILATMVLLLSRSVTVVEARRSIELNVLIVIACSLGISKALEKSGAAGFLAAWMIESVKTLGPIGLLAAIYVTTSALTEIITNNAAAALVFPIAMSAAQQAAIDPRPFAIAIAIAASASFATPIGYQTNLMVYGPGGYKFRDFLRVGIPLNILFMAVTLIVIPLVWEF